MPFASPKSFGTVVSGVTLTGEVVPKGNAVETLFIILPLDYGLRYLRSAAPLREELVGEVGLIAVWS